MEPREVVLTRRDKREPVEGSGGGEAPAELVAPPAPARRNAMSGEAGAPVALVAEREGDMAERLGDTEGAAAIGT